MPRIEVHERRDEIETKGRRQRQNDLPGRFGEETLGEVAGRGRVEFLRFGVHEGSHHQKHGQDDDVELDDGEDDKRDDVGIARSGYPIRFRRQSMKEMREEGEEER